MRQAKTKTPTNVDGMNYSGFPLPRAPCYHMQRCAYGLTTIRNVDAAVFAVCPAGNPWSVTVTVHNVDTVEAGAVAGRRKFML